MVLSSGNYDIIENGNVLTFDENSDITVLIKASSTFEFKMIFNFEENGGEKSLSSEVNEQDNIVVYKCLNFGSGAGTIEAINLGHVKSKKMFLHFWVTKMSANKFIRSVQYTVYKER